jgi:FtsZ-binding cell division protein ZapB
VKTIINNISLKVGKLIETGNELKAEKKSLQQDNDTLDAELQEKKRQIVALQDKVKLMNISKSVDTTKEDVKATRLKINEYVREIDKCIALLNK